jgi:hypothetical protein
MLGAGVVTIFVKNSKTTPSAAPSQTPSVVITSTPSESIQSTSTPSATATPSQEPSPTNSMKKSPQDDEGNAGQTPTTGVGWHPFGFALLVGALATGLWIRRAART